MFKFVARVWIIILAISIFFSLSLNIAVVGFASVGATVAGVYDAITGTTSAYTAAKDRALRAEKQAANMTSERNRLQAETAELIEERDRALTRSRQLFEQVETGNAHNSRLTDDIIANEARLESLEEELKLRERRILSLRDEIELRDTRITTLKDDITIRDTRIGELSDDAARHADELARKTDTVLYRGARSSLSDAVIDTNGRIAKRTATAATRNASSVVAEAIPYLGIAAMLAVTAYDLKDSCDTIKDLHALDVAIDPAKEFGPEENEVCGLSVPAVNEVWQQVKDGSEEAWRDAGEYLPSLPDFSLPSWSVLKFW
jgi:hypothetical protein